MGVTEPAVVDAFRRAFGGTPDGVWAAPGRVNLVGEHTDYNDGFVLPVAVDRATRVAVRLRRDGRVRGWSAQLGPGAEARLADLPGTAPPGWVAYAAGVAWALGEAGLEVGGGVDVAVDSDVPVGAGLASSAALACAVGLALADLSGGCALLDVARAAQRGERDVAGAPVGLMDQMVALLGRAGHALLLDCRSLTTEHLPLPLADAGLALLVVDTGVTHAHATSAYGDRRRECAAAARTLGVPALRDVGDLGEDEPDVLGALDPVLRRRARHVVTENARVRAAADLLRTGAVADLGPILHASHTSLRDDFAVSVAELDLAVETA